MSMNDPSVLIVGHDPDFARTLRSAIPSCRINAVTADQTSFARMNGHACEMVAGYDIVLFEADPDDPQDVAAIESVLAARENGAVFLALTGDDVTIGKARRLREAGVDEVVPSSIGSAELTALVEQAIKSRRADRNTSASATARPGQVIAVAQARGGIGATTVATNLACALVGRSTMFRKVERKRVALLDFDLQFGNANVYLDLEDNQGFLDLMRAGEMPDSTFVGGILQRHSSGLDLLCAPKQLVPLTTVRAEVIAALLDLLCADHDYVVVDLPRAMVDWIEPVLQRAARLALVTDTSVPCIRQARRMVDFLREDFMGLPVDFIVNREKKPMIKSDHHREAEKVLQTKLTHWLPDNPRLARAAVDLGRPVVEMKPGSDLAKALTGLAVSVGTAAQTARQLNA